MIIGNFTCNEAQDTYTGELATLTVATRKVAFQPIEAKGDKAPSYRVVSPSKTGNVELGAAWIKRSEEDRNYLSVKLDDPSLAQPIKLRSGAVRRQRGFHPRVVARQPQAEGQVNPAGGGPQGPPLAARKAAPGWRSARFSAIRENE
jgi:uncharacterized protein (DUF736 family)